MGLGMSWSWWPENNDGAEHEAWVQPIFNDGELGTSTSNGRGVIFDSVYNDHGQLVSERVRPYSEIAALRIVCSCGWNGPTWKLEELPAWAVDEKYREATDYGEERLFLPDWHKHLEPLKLADAATCPTCGQRTA